MSDINRTDEKFYVDRDVIKQGQVYVNHVLHMTSEDLHSKSDIAAELAHRDIELSRLNAKISELEETVHDYERGYAMRQQLIRELDVILNGNGSAIQATLADIVAQAANGGLPCQKDARRYRLEHKNYDDIWLHITSPTGKKASFNLGHKPADKLSFLDKVLLECAEHDDSQLNVPGNK